MMRTLIRIRKSRLLGCDSQPRSLNVAPLWGIFIGQSKG